MYVEGTCTGMFELLEVIKQTAISVGWKLNKEKEHKLNEIPKNLKGCLFEGDKALVDNDASTNGGKYYITMPRAVSIAGIEIDGIRDEDSFAVYGVLENNTEVLIKGGIKQSCQIDDENRYYRFFVREEGDIRNWTKKAKIYFKSDELQSKELYFFSTGSSGMEQIYVNLRVFLSLSDITNLELAVTSGYSDLVEFEDQLGYSLPAILSGHDKKIKYFINIDKNRFIIATGIYEPEDKYQKKPVYQIAHAGKIRIYGGEWALGSTFAFFGSSFDENKRFSDIDKGMIETPKVLFNSKIIDVNTNISNWNKNTLDIEPYPNGDLFCIAIYLYEENSREDGKYRYFNGELYGELDGIVKLASSAGINSEDTITLDNKEWVVLQDGVNSETYNMFAIRKD